MKGADIFILIRQRKVYTVYYTVYMFPSVPLRHAIITEKVKLLLTLYRPLPPLFYLVKPKLLALPPLPPKKKSAKIAL